MSLHWQVGLENPDELNEEKDDSIYDLWYDAALKAQELSRADSSSVYVVWCISVQGEDEPESWVNCRVKNGLILEE